MDRELNVNLIICGHSPGTAIVKTQLICNQSCLAEEAEKLETIQQTKQCPQSVGAS